MNDVPHSLPFKEGRTRTPTRRTHDRSIMGWPTLHEYLAERDASDAEPTLRAAGIERTADLLQLTATDLASLGVSVELQYKLMGQADHPVEQEAADEQTDAPSMVIRRRGPAASNELEGFLEKHGVGEAVPLLVELGIERLGDLQQLDADDIEHLGLPGHLAAGLVHALGMPQAAPPPEPSVSSNSAPAPRAAPIPMLGTLREESESESSGLGAAFSRSAKDVGNFIGGLMEKLGSRGSPIGERSDSPGASSPSAASAAGSILPPSNAADITAGTGQLMSAELGGPPPAPSPPMREMSRPALLMSESDADFSEVLNRMGSSSGKVQSLLAQHSFISE